MKLLSIAGLFCSLTLAGILTAEKNYDAAFAWGLVFIYNLKDLINEHQTESDS